MINRWSGYLMIKTTSGSLDTGTSKGANTLGTSYADDSDGFIENPLLELGYYNEGEDTSNWNWAYTWAENQWQEQDLLLRQNTNNFTGPSPGPTSPPRTISALAFYVFGHLRC